MDGWVAGRVIKAFGYQRFGKGKVMHKFWTPSRLAIRGKAEPLRTRQNQYRKQISFASEAAEYQNKILTVAWTK